MSAPVDRNGFPEELEGLTLEGLEKLTQLAIACARMLTDRQRATVIGHEAIEAILTASRPWDRTKCTLRRHVYQTVRSMCSTDRRTGQRERAAMAEAGASDQLTDALWAQGRSPLALLSDAETAAEGRAFVELVLARLRIALKDDPLALETLRGQQDDMKPQDIADKLGIDVELVYRAHDRIRDRIATIRKQLNQESES